MVTSSQGSCAPPTGTVTCNLGTIPAFDLATVDIAVTAPATTGLITNSATATTTDTDPDLSNNTATVETTVVDPGADLAIEMYAEPDPAATNAPLTYTLEVTNRGPDDATGVSVTDTLPGGVTFDDASPGCAHASGTVTCVVGPVARDEIVDLAITVITPSLPGTLTNTASVDGNEPDPDTDNNTVTVETQLRTPPTSA